MTWPPSAGDVYLEDPGPRAIFQGDVYEDVPFTRAGAGNNPPESDPALSASKRRHVATLLHPCDIVSNDDVTPIKAQPVVAVYDALEKGLAIRDDWEDVPAAVCPLPDLIRDGRTWVADFRMITTVDRSYLPASHRVRCLSELGWAVFRRHYIKAVTRAEFSIEDLLDVGKIAWVESEMETDWSRVSGEEDRPAFHQWLSAPDTYAGYASRRRALEAGEAEAVWEQLREALGSQKPGSSG